MSVNNSIFKGDDFKLKFQMLHLGIDVLFVIWSTTIGKIVSGHSHDCRFFFLVIFSFRCKSFYSFFLLESFYLQRKGGHPLGPPFFSLLLSFLFFASLHFSFSSLWFKFELLSEKWVFLRSVYPSCRHFNQTCSREARRVRFSVRS